MSRCYVWLPEGSWYVPKFGLTNIGVSENEYTSQTTIEKRENDDVRIAYFQTNPYPKDPKGWINGWHSQLQHLCW